MDKKYISQVIAIPHATMDKLASIQKALQEETGIHKLSKRQVVEFLANYWLKNLNNEKRDEG
jgi:mannitol/fructose-specific phosphotransferase system IIA component